MRQIIIGVMLMAVFAGMVLSNVAFGTTRLQLLGTSGTTRMANENGQPLAAR